MRLLLLLCILLVSVAGNAQGLTKANIARLKRVEDTMKTYSRKMIQERLAVERFMADSQFIRTLVRSLKTPYSFYYPFDSLETVSRIYAPDSSFRIFSWQFSRDENYFRQRGAIQMKTEDGSLKLFPLIDISEFTNAPQDSLRTNQNWIGAIYYGIIQKTYNNKTYYTLLGFDDNNLRSTKKWIEVLSFDAMGRPVFGGLPFAVKGEGAKINRATPRFCLEYKKEGKARMNYDRDLDMIVYDHLISEDNQPDKAFTMVPDGDYEGFKWTDGRWVHVEKVFDFKLKDGEAPLPDPLKDNAGKSNEEKLRLQSEKNKAQAEKTKAQETTTPKKIVPKKDKKKTQPDEQREY